MAAPPSSHTPPDPSPGRLAVRTITPDEHLGFIQSRPSVSFLQTPAWGEVKTDWDHESIGWHTSDGTLVGVGLVLYRQVPRLRRYLAYLPEGPAIDWTAEDLAGWLDPMVDHLRRRRAFGVRIGPPVVVRRWDAAAVKQGMSDDQVTRLGEVPPTTREPVGAQVVSQLHARGWQHQPAAGGFTAGQPQFNFQIPLRAADGTARPEDDLLKGMNQQWRRNIKKAAKEGVRCRRVPTEELDHELALFHELYRHTAERDGFTPRPLSYFTTMFQALRHEDADRIALFHAEHEGSLVASTVLVQVGEHAWYSYGASSSEKREVRGSNAVQWEMVRHAREHQAAVYDLRGITDTLAADDPHVGLIRFKVGTGGEAVEYAGEWDLPLNRLVYRAFRLYLARRG